MQLSATCRTANSKRIHSSSIAYTTHALKRRLCQTAPATPQPSHCSFTCCAGPAAASSVFEGVASSWRWFGFDTESCGLDVERHEVISIAAHDLESGDSYTALINPALHNPKYAFGAEAYHGIPKSLLESEGISCLDAFAGMVSFVNRKTLPGQTPAFVAHHGFKFHFPIMEWSLHRAAGAASEMSRAVAAAGGASATSSDGASGDDICASHKSSSSSGSRTSSRRRRRRSVTASAAHRKGQRTEQQPVQADAASHAPNLQQVPFVDACWPQGWAFHDTLLLARCLAAMQEFGSAALAAKLHNTTRSALAQALLPPPYTEADVTPRERAFADAASVARLSAVLLSLLQTSDTEDAQPPDNQQQKMQHSSSSSSHNYYVRLQQAHGPWLSKPRTLGPPNPGIRERFHIVRDEIRQAAVKASQATDGSGGSWLSMRSRDPVAYVVQYLV